MTANPAAHGGSEVRAPRCWPPVRRRGNPVRCSRENAVAAVCVSGSERAPVRTKQVVSMIPIRPRGGHSEAAVPGKEGVVPHPVGLHRRGQRTQQRAVQRNIVVVNPTVEVVIQTCASRRGVPNVTRPAPGTIRWGRQGVAPCSFPARFHPSFPILAPFPYSPSTAPLRAAAAMSMAATAMTSPWSEASSVLLRICDRACSAAGPRPALARDGSPRVLQMAQRQVPARPRGRPGGDLQLPGGHLPPCQRGRAKSERDRVRQPISRHEWVSRVLFPPFSPRADRVGARGRAAASSTIAPTARTSTRRPRPRARCLTTFLRTLTVSSPLCARGGSCTWQSTASRRAPR